MLNFVLLRRVFHGVTLECELGGIHGNIFLTSWTIIRSAASVRPNINKLQSVCRTVPSADALCFPVPLVLSCPSRSHSALWTQHNLNTFNVISIFFLAPSICIFLEFPYSSRLKEIFQNTVRRYIICTLHQTLHPIRAIKTQSEMGKHVAHMEQMRVLCAVIRNKITRE
jgi:hypothetical protein